MTGSGIVRHVSGAADAGTLKLGAYILRGGIMAEQRFKGAAGMGARGKNQRKSSQPKATRRRQKFPKLKAAKVKGVQSGSRAKQNQGKNQRDWHGARKLRVRRATKASKAVRA